MIKNVAPLTGGFMISSIVGFLISSVWIFPQSSSWGFTFSLIFALMFIAAMISMTYGPDRAMLHVNQLRDYNEASKKSVKKKK